MGARSGPRGTFFQTSKVTAAILCAKVSRAKCGFTPRATPGLVKVLERSLGRGSSRRGTLEDIFQIVIMVEVEPANGQDLLGAFPLATDKAIFSTGVRRQCQTTVGPELSLRPEAVRCLYERKQQNGTPGADGGNLPQQPHVQMLPAFRQ